MQFKDQYTVTVAAGTSCGSLGDERNLREFLVADEAVRALRAAGHLVHFYLFNDNLDPLEPAQLRVAVQKDAELQEKFKPYCGKPICSVPDPFGCHRSLSAHFEAKLMERLHGLDCNPTLINASDVYQSHQYDSFVEKVLRESGDILAFCAEKFPNYHIDQLFYVVCPICGYADKTSLEVASADFIVSSCERCGHHAEIQHSHLRGKLNYKVDCAVRWNMFQIDIETFGKQYLEPKSGSFVVSKALSSRFFGGKIVVPIPYGQVKIHGDVGYRLLPSLPPESLRETLVERPHIDLALTRDRAVLAASKYEVEPGVSFLDAVKQLAPAWILTAGQLSARERELLARAMAFAEHILVRPLEVGLPGPDAFEGESEEILLSAQTLLRQVLLIRRTHGDNWEEFRPLVKQILTSLGARKHATLHRLRVILKQTHGLPASKFLYQLPVDYLEFIEYVLSLKLSSGRENAAATSLILVSGEDPAPTVSGKAMPSD